MTDQMFGGTLVLKADQQSAAETRKALDDVAASLKDLGKSDVLQGTQAAFGDFNKSLDPVAARFKLLKDDLADAKVQEFEAAAAAQDYARALQEAANAAGELDRQQEQLAESALREADAIEQVAAAEADASQKSGGVPRDAQGRFLPRGSRGGASDAGGDNGFDGTPDDTGSDGSGGGRSFGQRLAGFGSSLRSLPSTQIPGTGIGTDAIANVFRLSGALSDVGSSALESVKALTLADVKQKVVALSATAMAAAQGIVAGAQAALSVVATTLTAIITGEIGVTTALAAASAAAAGGAALLVVALGPIAIIGIAVAAAVGLVALALSSASKEAEKNAKINRELAAQYEASDKVFNEIQSGATTDDLKKNRDAEKTQLKRDNDELAALQAENARVSADIRKNNLGGGLADSLAQSRGDDGFGARKKREEELKADIEKRTALEGEYASALDEGAASTNDAKDAEEKLAEARSKAALDSADSAGKEIAAQQRALDATTEQNTKRLESIDKERAVIEAQLASLQSSGVTSDEVTGKMKSLNAQLGLLGKESGFIKDTALAVSAQRDAEKSAEKFAEKQAALAETNAQKLTEIERGYGDKRKDITQKYNDDLVKLATDARRDAAADARKDTKEALERELKGNQEEQAEAVKQKAALDNIRKQAQIEEADQLKQRNFLGASLAREKGQQEIDNANATALEDAASREQQRKNDAALRAVDDEFETKERQIKLNEARGDRLSELDKENRDAKLARDRQLRDADANYKQQGDQAAAAFAREQQQYAAHLQAMTDISTDGYAAIQAAAKGQSQPLREGGLTTNNTSASSTSITDNRSLSISSASGLLTVDQLQRMALRTMQRVSY